MDSLTKIQDIDNIIYQWVRNIQIIDNSKINKEIKDISIDHKSIGNFIERVFYYNSENYGKYIKKTNMLMACCCTKCGNYIHKHYHKNLQCKCSEKEREKQGEKNFKLVLKCYENLI